jgi:hypothetical protein
LSHPADRCITCFAKHSLECLDKGFIRVSHLLVRSRALTEIVLYFNEGTEVTAPVKFIIRTAEVSLL